MSTPRLERAGRGTRFPPVLLLMLAALLGPAVLPAPVTVAQEGDAHVYVTGGIDSLTLWRVAPSGAEVLVVYLLGRTEAPPPENPAPTPEGAPAPEATPAGDHLFRVALAEASPDFGPGGVDPARVPLLGHLRWDASLRALVYGEPDAMVVWAFEAGRPVRATVSGFTETWTPPVYQEVETQVQVGTTPEGIGIYETRVEQVLVTPGAVHLEPMAPRTFEAAPAGLQPSWRLRDELGGAPAPAPVPDSACGGGACG